MLFNSYTFWIFFALVFLLHRRLPHKGQNRLLLVASYVFYGYWDWRFLSLILASTIIDYFVARAIADGERTERQKKQLLLASLVFNLGMLAVFKYLNFFVGGDGGSLPFDWHRRPELFPGDRPAGRDLVLHFPDAQLHGGCLSRKDPTLARFFGFCALRLVSSLSLSRVRSSGQRA